MLEGAARKVVLLLVFLSACGWIVFVTGFGIRNADTADATDAGGSVVHARYTSHWLMSVTGLVVYVIYFLHLLWGNVVTAVITLCVVPLYLAVLGAVLQFDSGDQPGGDFPSLLHSDDFELHLLVEYVGALMSGTFLWLALVLWPLQKYGGSGRGDYTPINN